MFLFILLASLLIAPATCMKMLGAPDTIINPDNDNSTVEIVNHVLDDENAQRYRNKTSPLVLVQVIEATRQVVSGHLYEVTFAAGKARCPSRKQTRYNVRRERCRLFRSGEMRIYKVKVVDAPWKQPPKEILQKDVLYSFYYYLK